VSTAGPAPRPSYSRTGSAPVMMRRVRSSQGLDPNFESQGCTQALGRVGMAHCISGIHGPTMLKRIESIDRRQEQCA